MTEQEVRELLQLIKNQNLFCDIELETDDTYLFEDTVRYLSCVVHVYAEKEKDRVVINMQLDMNPEDETYYLNDMSGRFGTDIQKHTLPVSDYCKNVIARYI